MRPLRSRDSAERGQIDGLWGDPASAPRVSARARACRALARVDTTRDGPTPASSDAAPAGAPRVGADPRRAGGPGAGACRRPAAATSNGQRALGCAASARLATKLAAVLPHLNE